MNTPLSIRLNIKVGLGRLRPLQRGSLLELLEALCVSKE